MEKVLIWGSGKVGQALLLRDIISTYYEIIGFCDTDEKKWGMKIGNYTIYSPNEALLKWNQGEMSKIIISVNDVNISSEIEKQIRQLLGNEVITVRYDTIETQWLDDIKQNLNFDKYDVNYQKQTELWLDNLMSEVEFWVDCASIKNTIFNDHYKERIANKDFNLDDSSHIGFVTEYLEKKTYVPEVYDIGCGLAPKYGSVLPNGNSIILHKMDPLAYFYNAINAKYAMSDVSDIEFGLFEFASSFFERPVDVIIINNALDHCFDPYKSIVECLNALKIGGVLHLNHGRAEGINAKYDGLHQWNIDYYNGDFVIWNYDSAVNISKKLDSIADIKITYSDKNTMRKDQYISVDMIKKCDFSISDYIDLTNEKKDMLYIIKKLMLIYSDKDNNNQFKSLLGE